MSTYIPKRIKAVHVEQILASHSDIFYKFLLFTSTIGPDIRVHFVLFSQLSAQMRDNSELSCMKRGVKNTITNCVAQSECPFEAGQVTTTCIMRRYDSLSHSSSYAVRDALPPTSCSQDHILLTRVEHDSHDLLKIKIRRSQDAAVDSTCRERRRSASKHELDQRSHWRQSPLGQLYWLDAFIYIALSFL